MAKFQEDMIFKNLSEEEADIVLSLVNKNSKHKKIWTKELRQLDPSTYKPDLIIELDDENLIIEFQSTDVDDGFSRRAHIYVAIADQRKPNDKDVNLIVISTSEESKRVEYEVNDLNVFRYDVFGNDLFDGEKVIKDVEKKYKQNILLSNEECIYFSLAPIMTKNGNLEKNIIKTVGILITLEDIPQSTKNLCFAMQWLIVDKFVKDEDLRNLLLDMLGDRMSAIYEYGERKEQRGFKLGNEQGVKQGVKQGIEQGVKQGVKQTVESLYNSGMGVDEISERLNKDVEEIKKLLH